MVRYLQLAVSRGRRNGRLETDAARRFRRVREYLLRGGFLMLDDFWGKPEWDRFMETMREIVPDRPIVDIENPDAIFHIVYDLDNRYQIMGQWAMRGGMADRWVGRCRDGAGSTTTRDA